MLVGCGSGRVSDARRRWIAPLRSPSSSRQRPHRPSCVEDDSNQKKSTTLRDTGKGDREVSASVTHRASGTPCRGGLHPSGVTPARRRAAPASPGRNSIHRPHAARPGPEDRVGGSAPCSRAVPLLTVVAPAGYGKTTLLAQWAAGFVGPSPGSRSMRATTTPTVLLTSIAGAARSRSRRTDRPDNVRHPGVDPRADDPRGGRPMG